PTGQQASSTVAFQRNPQSAPWPTLIMRSSIEGSDASTPTLKKNGQRISRTDFRGRSQFSPGSDTAPDLGPQGLPTFDSHDRPTSGHAQSLFRNRAGVERNATFDLPKYPTVPRTNYRLPSAFFVRIMSRYLCAD